MPYHLPEGGKMIKKSLIVLIMLFTSVVIFSCGSPSTSRTSNVKKVLESRAAQDGNNIPKSAPNVISNGSDMKRSAVNPNTSNAKVMKVDLDLSQLNSTICDAYLRELQGNKEQYRGIVVKATGEYNYYKDEITNKEYYNCVFASTCCPNGLEFILADPTKYPKQNGGNITVIGQFDYYDENGIIYYNLVNATIV